MSIIGGKTKTPKVTKPMFVVKAANHINEYALFKTNEEGALHINWIGDPNAATKFDSKYQAKYRTREIDDVPATRCFVEV